jgi:hypothetical protein
MKPMHPPSADLVLQNAKIWTVDDQRPWAKAVAIRGNEIMAIGSPIEMDALITA